MVNLQPRNLPDKKLAFTNRAYVSPRTFSRLQSEADAASSSGSIAGPGVVRCTYNDKLVVNVEAYPEVSTDDIICLSKLQRRFARVTTTDPPLPLVLWRPAKDLSLHVAGGVVFDVSSKDETTLREELLSAELHRVLDSHVLTEGQEVAIQLLGQPCHHTLRVISLHPPHLGGRQAAESLFQGLVVSATEFEFDASDSSVQFAGSNARRKKVFKQGFDFSQLGIGGLDQQFNDLFRRAFASRSFSPQLVKQCGINHVRGILLFGPPGTGKTLIARQIGKALNATEPKLVNGPEVLNKFVGQSEENIRNLFKDAEKEQREKGDNSSLHIIIFDEIDAICKQRGTSSTSAGVNDSVVNQLLSKIDGVDALNNILLIGMTNRKDLLDEALLRPGRLEVHLEIGLPDTKGREQIFEIHTAALRENKRLADDVSLKELALRTQNYSGAEIAGVVRSAVSFAFQRHVDPSTLDKVVDESTVIVGASDFVRALQELRPAFGVRESDLEKSLRHGIIFYGSMYQTLIDSLMRVGVQVRDQPETPIMSVLLLGERGVGKTATAAHVARQLEIPFVRIISPDQYVARPESDRLQSIRAIFEDAYKSKCAVVIIDEVERLMDYSPIGVAYSNPILQTLLVVARKAPPKSDHRILIIATSSEAKLMFDSGLRQAFHLAVNIPRLEHRNHMKNVLTAISRERDDLSDEEIEKIVGQLKRAISIRDLIQVYHTASDACGRQRRKIDAKAFADCLADYGFV